MGEKIRVDTFRAPDLWITEADPVELEASIINLAINARDAMPEGGRLTIDARNAVLDADFCAHFDSLPPGQYVHISVLDQGTGMTADVLEHVFEPFFTTEARGPGSGLGLSQVYGFVRQSSGHVTIESEISRGTTVNLYLPRSNATTPVLLEETNREILNGRGEVVLVVEDDRGVREHLVEMLRDMNYFVLAAENADEALGFIWTFRGTSICC